MQAKEEAKTHLIKNDRLARFQNRAGQVLAAGVFREVEDPTPRPSKHYFFHEEVDRPQDPKQAARDQGDSVTNLIQGQDYHKLSRGLKDDLFVDKHFSKTSGIQWLRPHQISKDPKFVVGKRDRFDVNQGELGNCWFLSALANLAENGRCFDRVVPRDQDFDKGKYKGIFRFRFFRLNPYDFSSMYCFDRFNSWVEVVVDDLLPTRNGKLIYLRSRQVPRLT